MEYFNFIVFLITVFVVLPVGAVGLLWAAETAYNFLIRKQIKISLDEGAQKPYRAHELDAGYDLFAMRDIYVQPQGKVTADTGVHIEIPAGYFGDIRPKSGLLFKHDLATFGTVDSGYTGSVKVRIINLGHEPYQFHKGDKIAQMVLVPCLTPDLYVVEKLEETERGDGGFGSTGR